METPQHLSATTTLTTLLRQTALGVVEAQAALDAYSETQAAERDASSAIPVLAFGFSDVEIDLSLGISITSVAGQPTLSVLALSPLGHGFFQTTSFSSRLRAHIAPIAHVAPAHVKENRDE